MTRWYAKWVALMLLLVSGCGDSPTPQTPATSPTSESLARTEFDKGVAFAEREDWDTAIACFSAAIRLKPSDPASHPVTPADIVATIYRCLGINPDTPVYEPNGRPVPVRHGGQPIEELLA